MWTSRNKVPDRTRPKGAVRNDKALPPAFDATQGDGYRDSGAGWQRSSAGRGPTGKARSRSEEHTSELQSLRHLVCRLLLEKKKKKITQLRQRLAGCTHWVMRLAVTST